MLSIPSKKVILSERAYLAIIAETYERYRTETGGIFLGIRTPNTWYVIETLDPGPNSIFQPGYFEYDTAYVNHLSNKIARFYRESIELLGLWHRHPGSFDSFSSTDDGTNKKYASQNSDGAISALVNLDPTFRLTMYHVSNQSHTLSRPKYTKIPVDVGNQLIPERLLAVKSVQDYFPSTKPTKKGRVNDSKSSRYSMGNLFSSIGKNIGEIFGDKQETGEPILNNTENNQLISSLERLIEVIEPELSYLENQVDYEYQIKRNNDQIKIDMQYTGEMSIYPSLLQWTFWLSKDNQPLVKVNDSKVNSYKPKIINSYISHEIEKNSDSII